MKKGRRLRLIVQLVFLVLIALIAVNHSLSEAGKGIPLLAEASLHAVCPFGGVVSIYRLLTSGSFVKKVHESSLVLMYIVFGAALLAGPLFCGWICPFGTVQEALGRLGKRIFRKRYNHLVPSKADSLLRYLRYLVLVMVLVMTARSGELLFASVDPYYALFQFWTGEVALSALIVLAVVLLLSLAVERPFCKYACPYGAVLGLFNLIRIFPLKRNAESCISCGRCDRYCPMNIRVSEAGTVRNHQCISCYRCVSTDGACPEERTLDFVLPLTGGSGRRIPVLAAALVLPLFFVLGIGGTMAAGYWRTESSKIPARYTEGELAGEYDPADIRGSYSLGDLEKAFGIPVETLAKAYGVSSEPDPASVQIKRFEELYGVIDGREVGTDSMRLFIALYLDRPYSPEEDTALPRPAYQILLKEGKADRELLEGMEDRVVLLDHAAPSETAESEGTLLTEIKGKTTFAELLDRGLTREQIERVLGMSMGARADSVRDFCMAQGIEFSGVKSSLQGLLDDLDG